jgi:hypothetical protein
MDIGEGSGDAGGGSSNVQGIKTMKQELKEYMTTLELLRINESQAVTFTFSRLEGKKSFKGAVASLVCDLTSKVLGQWVCQVTGEDNAQWRCEWS